MKWFESNGWHIADVINSLKKLNDPAVNQSIIKLGMELATYKHTLASIPDKKKPFYIWARASFSRIRYAQLMSDCWTILLPLVISLIIMILCVIYIIDIIPCNIPMLCYPEPFYTILV